MGLFDVLRLHQRVTVTKPLLLTSATLLFILDTHLVVLGRSGGLCGTTRPARLSSWVTAGATSGNSRLSWPSVKRISAVESCSTCYCIRGMGRERRGEQVNRMGGSGRV